MAARNARNRCVIYGLGTMMEIAEWRCAAPAARRDCAGVERRRVVAHGGRRCFQVKPYSINKKRRFAFAAENHVEAIAEQVGLIQRRITIRKQAAAQRGFRDGRSARDRARRLDRRRKKMVVMSLRVRADAEHGAVDVRATLAVTFVAVAAGKNGLKTVPAILRRAGASPAPEARIGLGGTRVQRMAKNPARIRLPDFEHHVPRWLRTQLQYAAG